MPATNPDKLSSQPALRDICLQAIACLDEGLRHPPPDLKRKVDEAENLVVKLRDRLIEEIRKDDAAPAMSSPWRRPLDQVNTTLSLVIGVAYPSAHIHHRYVEEALQLLHALAAELPD